ncbi:hypothetical protein OSB04_000268 [Centaurea solstitialis]|uniref:RRM domain-containing protein n=1 Tax=Centaurea solstitialis TaxID=347529 RepID=A0AA38WKD3_9ASTR|nr:hypothetical protein OSB04_000268 [Centaurea solstitialis]
MFFFVCTTALDRSSGFLRLFHKMAFLGRVGNSLKQSGSKHANIGLSSTSSPLFQAIRSMSSAKLFIAGLPYATDEIKLKDAFQQYGEVIDVTVITDRDSRRSRGFGFVRYFSAEDANTALQEMNGKVYLIMHIQVILKMTSVTLLVILTSALKMAFLGKVGNLLKQSGSKHASIGLSSTNSPLFQAIRSMSSAKLFVGGLSYGTDEMGLREAFQQYGEVIDAKVITDRDSGRSRGFGFVSYTSADAANTALQDMDGKELHGRRIRVNFAQERPRPSFGGGGYGGVGGGYGALVVAAMEVLVLAVAMEELVGTVGVATEELVGTVAVVVAAAMEAVAAAAMEVEMVMVAVATMSVSMAAGITTLPLGMIPLTSVLGKRCQPAVTAALKTVVMAI